MYRTGGADDDQIIATTLPQQFDVIPIFWQTNISFMCTGICMRFLEGRGLLTANMTMLIRHHETQTWLHRDVAVPRTPQLMPFPLM